MTRRWIALLALVVCPAVASAQQRAASPTPCELQPAPTTRLRYDSLPGIGAVTFIGGGADIRCPQRGITLKGDSAERFADHYQVVGNAVYDEPRVHVTADYLNYFPTDERIVAAGNVNARLPNGSTLVGPQAELRRAVPRVRPRQQVSAIGRPTITLVQKDSTGKPQPPATVVANTVFMDGDSLIYGSGQVVITRPDISASADSAFINEGTERMQLMRNPVLRGKREKPFTLIGTEIDLYSSNRKVSRVIAKAAARAFSDSMQLTSDTIDLRVRNDLLDHAYAWGVNRAKVVSPSQTMIADSLDVYMPGQRIQLVRALRKAYAQGIPDSTKFRVEAPDTTDWLVGDTIVAYFDSTAAAKRDTTKNPAIKMLVSSGHASSLYHLAPSDTSERRPALNHVTARLITINFDSQKVATVTTVDSVSGIYIEPRSDSTSRRRNGTNPAPAPGQPAPKVPSVVPLPSKPPTRP
jgi:hypothetical protein